MPSMGLRMARALHRYSGLHRRLEDRGTHRGVRWIDDYAHHPTELRTALAAVREMHPGRPVTCVFQPHQASRTAALFAGFVDALRAADRVAVAKIFRAREGPPSPGEPTAADLADALRCRGVDVAPCHGHRRIAAWLARRVCPDEVLLTAGAGDVDLIGSAWCGLSAQAKARRLIVDGAHDGAAPNTEEHYPCRG